MNNAIKAWVRCGVLLPLLTFNACQLMLGPTTTMAKDFDPSMYPKMAVYVEDASGDPDTEVSIESISSAAIKVVEGKGYIVPGNKAELSGIAEDDLEGRAIDFARSIGAEVVLSIEVTDLRTTELRSSDAAHPWFESTVGIHARVFEASSGTQLWMGQDCDREALRKSGVTDEMINDLVESVVSLMPPRSSSWWL